MRITCECNSSCSGRCKGTIMYMTNKAGVRYTHCRTGKGNLRGWLWEIVKEDREECRWCGEGFEDGEHIVFRCDSREVMET